jgi:hypothetical protein
MWSLSIHFSASDWAAPSRTDWESGRARRKNKKKKKKKKKKKGGVAAGKKVKSPKAKV